MLLIQYIFASQINNAGIARGKTILETKPEEFLLTYKVNVLGCHNILREFLPHSESLDTFLL
jgi:NADP-dependent 3-hydroxy acid dehydrogenase YdfG